jgi:hypothetical protein
MTIYQGRERGTVRLHGPFHLPSASQVAVLIARLERLAPGGSIILEVIEILEDGADGEIMLLEVTRGGGGYNVKTEGERDNGKHDKQEAG